MNHIKVKIEGAGVVGPAARKSCANGSTARKEVIRCLMVQHRGRYSPARGIIAEVDQAIEASWAALPAADHAKGRPD